MRNERFEGDRRPSPDALLETTRRRGRLKIFLGAAPGVGKTFEMLSAAQTKRREGVEVVVGVVETHGRKETEALLAGLEVIPRRKIDYKGRWIEQMDLDAILTRRPQLALVDELAHTNAPESRHPKRYQDVEELAGGRDRRLHDAEYPACGKSERRRRQNHPHPGARDGTGLDHRSRGRH